MGCIVCSVHERNAHYYRHTQFFLIEITQLQLVENDVGVIPVIVLTDPNGLYKMQVNTCIGR